MVISNLTKTFSLRGLNMVHRNHAQSLGVIISDDLAWGSTHNNDTRQGITKTLLFAYFEAGRCGKYSYTSHLSARC